MDIHEVDGRTFHFHGVPEFPAHLTPFREVRYLRTADRRTLGLVVFDRCDRNYSAGVFRRDALGRYLPRDVRTDFPTADAAEAYLARAMLDAAGVPADRPVRVVRLPAE